MTGHVCSTHGRFPTDVVSTDLPALTSKLRYDGRVPSLRQPEESDGEFRTRAERLARIAQLLVEACLGNRLVQELIAEGRWTESLFRQSPTVRIEYEQAIAIGGIGETLDATRSKQWGAGPWVLPLEPDDEFFPDRITYRYHDNSLYNRRFEQRQRLKGLLGRPHRGLVGHAQHRLISQAIFLRDLTSEQERAIRRTLNIGPVEFWRACRGKTFLSLPERATQLELPFDEPATPDNFSRTDGDL